MQNTQTAKLQYLNEAGIDLIQLIGLGGAVQFSINALGGMQSTPTLITANGAINPRVAGVYVITKGSIASMTLAAPTATTDDGLVFEVISNTAFAHVVTATGLLQTGTASVNSITFPAFAGANATFTAYQGKWNLQIPGNGVYTLA